MTIKEVSITYGGKINLGSYSSLHVEMTASALLGEGETLEDAAAELYNRARQIVREEARHVVEKRGVSVEEIFAGLPVEVQAAIQKGAK